MSEIILDILKATPRFIIEIICFYTGELILFVLTLGKRKPRKDFYTSERGSKFVIFSEFSTWLGLAFWIFLIGFIARNFLLSSAL